MINSDSVDTKTIEVDTPMENLSDLTSCTYEMTPKVNEKTILKTHEDVSADDQKVRKTTRLTMQNRIIYCERKPVS